MQAQRPGVEVVLWKLDASKCYKRIPYSVAEYHRCSHKLGLRTFLDTRLEMGAEGSADFASECLGVIVDRAAELGIVCELWVDDMIGVSWADEGDEDLNVVASLWRHVNWPFGEDKVVRPCTRVPVLGVLVDTVAGTCAVTPERRQKLVARMAVWLKPGATASPRDFSKLAGALEWCTMLLPHSKTFMRLLYQSSCRGSAANDEQAPVSTEVQCELQWFSRVLSDLTAVASFTPRPNAPELTVWTDASGWGYGAVCKQRQEVLFGQWSDAERSTSGIAH